MARVMDGKHWAQVWRSEIKDAILLRQEEMTKANKCFYVNAAPRLLVVSAGDNEASKVYIRQKENACKECGIEFAHRHYDASESSTAVLTDLTNTIGSYRPNGIIIQLPLPTSWTKQTIESMFKCIPGRADVDGLCENTCFSPCTPLGIMKLLEYEQVPLDGKNVTVIGRSNLVGMPLAHMMNQANATVTLAHSHTKALSEAIHSADIIVAAVGKPNLVNPLLWDIDEEGTPRPLYPYIIDVGINRKANGKLCGDVDPEVYDLCTAYTPVPGGVGPMTVAALMYNTYLAWYDSCSLHSHDRRYPNAWK